MKKATLTIGLFTLVMTLTSFTTPKTPTSSTKDNTTITAIDGTGNQDVGRNKKKDFKGNEIIKFSTVQITAIDGTGNQDVGRNKKKD
jgi:hypothetical protein